MMRFFLLLFIIVPALEILTIIQVGHVIGGWPTFFLLIAMSFLGAYLMKTQGLRTLAQIRQEMAAGMLPGESLLDGACILVGGVLLLTPGFLTDAFGLLLLLPFFRSFAKGFLKLWLMRLLQSGRVTLFRR